VKLLFLAMAIAAATTPTPHAEVDWAELNVDEALQRASEEGKRVFALFDAPWCGPCKTLHRKVLDTPEGGELLAPTIAIRVNIDEERNRPFVKRYRARVVPTALVLRADGTEVGRVRGFPGRARWMKRIRALIGEGDDREDGPSF